MRSYIAAHASEQTPASTLERIAGIDRYAIARQFRRAYGTSPDRYRTCAGSALARTAIEEGVPLARAAADCGFADQSHMTRQFVRAYGLTPGRWAAIAAAVWPSLGTGDLRRTTAGFRRLAGFTVRWVCCATKHRFCRRHDGGDVAGRLKRSSARRSRSSASS